MSERRHRALHRFVEERASDSYRSAFYYEGDDWETLYVRDDVATNRLRHELPDLVERARSNQPLLREDDYPPLGELGATTEVHEDGAILHFPEGPDEGTIISLDRDVAHRLTGFVTEAMSILQTGELTTYQAATVDD
ncbi:hypothetical protein ABSL23_06235 [Halobacterium sp. NMX12-1]|jgi:hypothetical protein|uniref:Uncharacterized protein n=1 Tax=Halobacterium sp. NMX12-1 TaxID=3166650 RepID=A0AAU8CHA8_9EURY